MDSDVNQCTKTCFFYFPGMCLGTKRTKFICIISIFAVANLGRNLTDTIFSDYINFTTRIGKRVKTYFCRIDIQPQRKSLKKA